LMLVAVGGCAGTAGNESPSKTAAGSAAPDPSTSAINGIPLPPGHWQAIDAGDQAVSGGSSGRIIYVSTVRGIVDRVVLVHRMTLGLRYQFQPRRSCADPGYFYQEPERPLPEGGACWHIRAVNLGLAGDPHWLNRALAQYADGQDLYLPVVMLGPRFIRYQGETLVQVDYLWNPDLLLSPPAGTLWRPEDWSNAAVADDPAKGAVMSTLVRWARQWQPRLEPGGAAG
jgi:hypothetical protein